MALYTREGARRALFHTVGFRVLSPVATVLSYVVLVRAMSAFSLGVYSLLYSVIPVIGAVASLGARPGAQALSARVSVRR